MKVYVASSWRNERHRQVVAALREAGHIVYDYRNPAHGGWSETAKWWERPGYMAVTFPVVVGDVPARQLAFNTDMDALREANAVVLVLDSGKSAHLEAGFAAGWGSRLVVLGDPSQNPELMYGMADACVVTLEEVVAELARPRRMVPIEHVHPAVALDAIRRGAVIEQVCARCNKVRVNWCEDCGRCAVCCTGMCVGADPGAGS